MEKKYKITVEFAETSAIDETFERSLEIGVAIIELPEPSPMLFPEFEVIGTEAQLITWLADCYDEDRSFFDQYAEELPVTDREFIFRDMDDQVDHVIKDTDVIAAKKQFLEMIGADEFILEVFDEVFEIYVLVNGKEARVRL